SKERRKEKKRQSQSKKTVSHYMFGASVNSGKQPKQTSPIYDNHKQITNSRVEKIPALQWCRSNVALTKKKSKKLNHRWGNCSGSVPWWVLQELVHGQQKNRLRHVILYSRTASLRKKLKVVPPCMRCQKVMDHMNRRMHVIVHSC